MRQLFLNSGVHDRFDVSLLHKHFPIQENERLVDCRNISGPWTVDDNRDPVVPKYEGFIKPCTFRVFEGQFIPYEFDFADSPLDNGHPEFLEKLAALLHQYGLEDVLGVRLLDKYDPGLSVEVTEGKTNIMILRGSVKESDLIEALWVFEPNSLQKCHCREYCITVRGQHTENHGCS